jgi:homoserine O-acetyltransferase
MSLLYDSTNRSFLPEEHHLQLDANLDLESGGTLERPVIAYQTWGRLDKSRSNVIWVCHALTGNHRIHEWWDGLFGIGKCFDPKDYFIVSVNVLGSCYGTTGPLSYNGQHERYHRSFPQVTIRDMVKALEHVRIFLELEQIFILIGASVGGQQVLEWAVQKPELFGSIIPIATNVRHSPYGIAFNEAQRLAIEADPTFEQDLYCGGRNGLIAARAMGMLSYRSYEGYGIAQSETDDSKTDQFKAASYQRYQGEKLSKRFNAYSYWYLSKAMDSHNIARDREPAASVLQKLTMPALVVGIDSDQLFPLQEQQFIAEHLPCCSLAVVSSRFGHDGFLVEFDQLTEKINRFLTNKMPGNTLQKHCGEIELQ